MILGLSVLLILVGISLTFLKNYKLDTYNFLISGIEDVANFIFYNEKNGNIETLLENFSDNINVTTFVYGNGHKIQNSGDIPNNIIFFEGVYSDMGYLNDIYMGGILYMLLLYIPIMYFLLKKVNTVKISNKEKCIYNILKIS